MDKSKKLAELRVRKGVLEEEIRRRRYYGLDVSTQNSDLRKVKKALRAMAHTQYPAEFWRKFRALLNAPRGYRFRKGQARRRR